MPSVYLVLEEQPRLLTIDEATTVSVFNFGEGRFGLVRALLGDPRLRVDFLWPSRPVRRRPRTRKPIP
mgnify:CR=1 FL=1